MPSISYISLSLYGRGQGEGRCEDILRIFSFNQMQVIINLFNIDISEAKV